jgi:hypothetical protein
MRYSKILFLVLALSSPAFSQLRGFINAERDLVPVTTVSGSNFISEFKPLSFFSFAHSVFNASDGYLYFAVLSKGGSPHNRDHYVFKYNKTTHAVVSSFEVPKSAGITSSYDTHPIPVITEDAAGQIYMIVEKGANSTGWSDGHETDCLIYKTTSAGDLSTMVLWKTLAGEYSYPSLYIDGANYYMMARGRRTINAKYITVEKSTDTGATWTEIGVHVASGNYIPYSTKLESDDGLIWRVIHQRADVHGTFTEIDVIKSADGVTWSNAQGTWSKDVVTNGAITSAELQANCRVDYVGSESAISVFFEGGKVEGGVIKLLVSFNDVDGGIIDGNVATVPDRLYLYTVSAGVWDFEDLSSLLPAVPLKAVLAFGSFTNYNRTSTSEHITIIDRSEQLKTVVREFSSTDGFATHTERVLMTGTFNLYMGSSAANFEDGKFVILFNTIGSYNNATQYSDLKIIDLN